MKPSERISIRLPEAIMKLLDQDVKEHRLKNISQAARKRLQFSANHDELLREMQQLRKSQKTIENDLKILMFALRQSQQL